MPSPFDITTATNTVTLDNKRAGTAVFTVKNNMRRRIHAAAKLTTQPPQAAQWLTMLPPDTATSDSANLRDFPIDSTQQIQVRIAVPSDAAPASYTISLILADEVNPDENFSASPDVIFTVREIPKPAPRPFPTWIVPAVLIGIFLIAAIVVGGVALSNRQQPTPTASGPCSITMKAAQFVYQQPDTISNSMFDQVQSGAQLTPVGKSADNGWWKTSYYETWIQTSLLGDTALVSGDCTQLPAICLITIRGDLDLYSQPDPNPNNRTNQAHAGWQLVPTGKLATNSWWKIGTQNAWIQTSVFGSTAQTSGDCSGLPVVSA